MKDGWPSGITHRPCLLQLCESVNYFAMIVFHVGLYCLSSMVNNSFRSLKILYLFYKLKNALFVIVDHIYVADP